MMSGDRKSTSFSESLVLDDSEKGVIITGITDDAVAAKSGLQAGDEIVAATIHLDHLNKNEVLNILKVLEPYDNNMKVLTKKELSASAGLGSLGLDLKDSAEMLTEKRDLSLDESAETTVVSLDGLSGKLNTAQGLGGEISGPTLNGDLPSLNSDKPSADAGAKFTMPSIGLTGPDIKNDLDGTLKTPDVSVSTPKVNTSSAMLDIKKPEINTSNLKYKAAKFKMPQFNQSQLKTQPSKMDVSGDVDLPVSENLETPDLNLSAPKLDLRSPDFDPKGQNVDLNGSNGNLEAPNIDTEPASGKFKWPHLKWKGPKVKGPDADLNVDSTPKIDGDLSAPDVDINLPKADIKGPDVDAQTQNLDIDAPLGKIKWPHLKWKKQNLHGPKSDLDIPDVDINLPKADLKGPDVHVKTLNIDEDAPSGKIQWPHLRWKKPNLQGPKADLEIDTDLNTSDLNLSSPKIEGGINAPNAELNVPKADLKGPNVDVQAPDLDIDAPSGKINWPHLKWKKPKLHGPKADMDVSVDLNTPDVDLSVPKIDHEISTTDADLNLSKVDTDIKALDADIEAPSGKIRFPTLKKPKFLFSGPKMKAQDDYLHADADVKAPDLSLSPQATLDGPDVDLNLPKAGVDVKAPNADIEAPSGKFKWLTLKKSKLSISDPKVNSPDIDRDVVSDPGLNLSAPKMDGEITAPDVNLNLANADLESPKLDVNAPDVEGVSGKFKWFTFKKSKFGTLKGPKADVDANVKGPDVDLKGTDVDLSAPDVNLSAPNFDPSLDIPKVSVDAPNVDIEAPDLSLSTPKIKGGLEAPDLDINLPKADLRAPDVDHQAPEVDASAGKFKLSKIKLPKFGSSGPRVKGPNLDVDADLRSADLDQSLSAVDVQLPKADLSAADVNLKASDLNISTPKTEGGIAAPKLNLSLPKVDLKELDVDLKTADVDIDSPSGRFNIGGPKAQLPDAELKTSGVSVPDVDLTSPTADVNTPNLNLSAPTIKGELGTSDLELDADLKTDIDPKTNINLPGFNLSTPKINTPGGDLEGDQSGAMICTSGNLSAPNLDIKLPPAELEAPDVTLEAPNVDINLPKVDLKGPDSQLKTPGLASDSCTGDFKLPHFKLPELDLSSPEVEVPTVNSLVEGGTEAPQVYIGTTKSDANISVPAIDLRGLKLEGDIKGPEIDVKAPNVDATHEESKLPHFKLPKLGFSGSKTKAPEVSTSADVSPDVNIKALSVEGGIRSADVSVSAPEVKTSLNTPELDVTAEADAEVKGSPKSKLRWPFKWGLKSGSGTDEEGSGADSETDVSYAEVEVPVFKFHKLPRNSIDGIGGIDDSLGFSKLDTEAKDYVISKGICLPIVNATSKAGEKIDIMERLKIAKEKAPSANVSTKTDIDLKLAAPSLDVSASTEAGDFSFVRGGTYKLDKPESVLVPEILTSDENHKLSLGLSNMLGLNVKDSDAD